MFSLKLTLILSIFLAFISPQFSHAYNKGADRIQFRKDQIAKLREQITGLPTDQRTKIESVLAQIEALLQEAENIVAQNPNLFSRLKNDPALMSLRQILSKIDLAMKNAAPEMKKLFRKEQRAKHFIMKTGNIIKRAEKHASKTNDEQLLKLVEECKNLFQQARSLFEAGNTIEAVKIALEIRQKINEQFKDQLTSEEKEEIKEQLENLLERAENLYTRLLENSSNEKTQTVLTQVRDLLDKARQAYQENQYPQARHLLHRALALMHHFKKGEKISENPEQALQLLGERIEKLRGQLSTNNDNGLGNASKMMRRIENLYQEAQGLVAAGHSDKAAHLLITINQLLNRAASLSATSQNKVDYYNKVKDLVEKAVQSTASSDNAKAKKFSEKAQDQLLKAERNLHTDHPGKAKPHLIAARKFALKALRLLNQTPQNDQEDENLLETDEE